MGYMNNVITISDALTFLQEQADASIPLFLFSPPYNLGITSGGANSIERRMGRKYVDNPEECTSGAVGKWAGGVLAGGYKRNGHYPEGARLGQRGGSGKWKGGELADGYGEYDDAMPMDKYIAWQHDILRECWRCLPPAGAIFYNHKPRVLDGVLLDPMDYVPGELIVRQRIIWARAGGINFTTTAYCPTHEEILIIAKPDFRLKSKGASGAGSVWYIPQEANTWHPAPFPMALAETVLETTMPTLVCDPFSGSGTVARAAKRFGIDFIGCDRNAAYVERANAELAKERRMTVRQKTMIEAIEDQQGMALDFDAQNTAAHRTEAREAG